MKTSHGSAAAATAAALILFFTFASAAPAAAAAPKGKAYTTPEAAVEAFVGAVRGDDLQTLLAIFGDGSERIFVSEDPTADRNQRQEFLRLYDEKHEIVSLDENMKILLAGADAWPLPIPLVKTGTGWAFDTVVGLEEIINRRVGRNELSAIQTCLAIADAQREYFRRDHDGDGILEYARKFRSTVGLRDGLYWHAPEGEPQSPVGELVATATQEGYGPADTAYHGYRYKLLTSQSAAAPGGAYDYLAHDNLIGGFALLAYPAAYGDSGIMSFILSHSGVVYQKDLGENTAAEAQKMEAYNPDGWTKVTDQDIRTIPEP
ncbi:MAG TPA: DUF2950 domain-containing protein [Thermoanaerobaculia bacterium]